MVDDLKRSIEDSRFFRRRLRGQRNVDAAENAYHRGILELLRWGTPSRHTLRLAAAELERLWRKKGDHP
jgi:hypothetical protein